MYAGKPIIGLAGGIGSGKSFIARCFGELGSHVIDSDEQVRDCYREPAVIQTLQEWWGPAVVDSHGQVNRKFIAQLVFGDPNQRKRLESLIHPRVEAAREQEMHALAHDPRVLAFIWDTPLLFEVGLNKCCDCVVFVDSTAEDRQGRVAKTRGWNPEELIRRENLQLPLDKKRQISDYVLSNTADAAQARDQVRDLFPRILAQVAKRSGTDGRVQETHG